MILPHTYPFRLVDRSAGRARLSLSTSSFFGRNGAAPGLPLLVEAAAQAAALEWGRSPHTVDELRLAALSEVELLRAPTLSSVLTFELTLDRALGGLSRVTAAIQDEIGPVARMQLVLSAAGSPR